MKTLEIHIKDLAGKTLEKNVSKVTTRDIDGLILPGFGGFEKYKLISNGYVEWDFGDCVCGLTLSNGEENVGEQVQGSDKDQV